MEQPGGQDGDSDVLTFGEGRDPRWGRAGAVVLVLLLAFGAYRLATAPDTPAVPAAQEATAQESAPEEDIARDRSSSTVLGQLPPWVTDDLGVQGTTLRLGGRPVTLRGPGVGASAGDTSATSLRPVPGGGWLVRVTTSCERSGTTRTTYGSVRRSGRFTPWDTTDTLPRRVWRSPDRDLVLLVDGDRLEVRPTSASMTLAEYRSGQRSSR